MQQALLLIDIQNDYFPGGHSELYQPEAALLQAQTLLTLFRSKQSPVIHVQHINTRPGATFFLPGSKGAEIHPSLKPLEGEQLVVKHAPSSFYQTKLEQILLDSNIQQLVVCGMMSHMCIDTTVRACKDYGIDVILIEDACATKDLVYQNEVIPAQTVHKTFMAALDKMFAQVIQAKEFTLA